MARTDRQDAGKSWIFWGGGLLIVIVVVIVGLLTIPTGSNEAEEPDEGGLTADGPDPSAQPVEPDEEPIEGDAPARCEDLDGDGAFPTEAPEFTWEDFDGVEDFAVPVSDEHGPAVQEDGFWRCFSQTPAGAAFASQGLFWSFNLGGHYEAAVASPGAEAAMPDDPAAARESANGLMRGFRIVDSSDEEATVQLWAATPDGSTDAMYEILLVWDDSANDWRLDLAGGLPELQELTDTTDFTEWR